MQKPKDDPRIGRMLRNDSMWSIVAIMALWALYGFVLYELVNVGNVTDTNVLTALAVGGFLVVLFNTAAIIAMIQHYAEDKEHIYGLDLHYLDLSRQQREGAAKLVPVKSPTTA